MKYLLFALICATTIGVSSAATDPVSAAPEKARVCPPKKLVLPLDHGPHATTTPAKNKARKARYEADVKACKEAAK